VHGFDLTFCAPKSVSLVRAVRGDDVIEKAVIDAHTTALTEAMEYLAQYAGYTRVHNSQTGEKDLVRLPGWWRSPTSTRHRVPVIRTCTPT
jgi:TrwC relaxase